jgi:hypothetical protein
MNPEWLKYSCEIEYKAAFDVLQSYTLTGHVYDYYFMIRIISSVVCDLVSDFMHMTYARERIFESRIVTTNAASEKL